jgi:IS6 family transposase
VSSRSPVREHPWQRLQRTPSDGTRHRRPTSAPTRQPTAHTQRSVVVHRPFEAAHNATTIRGRFSIADANTGGSVALVDLVLGGDRVGVYRRSAVESVSFAGYRFPPEVILFAVRWYLRYGLSYRDVEELLAERGIDVDHVTIYRWVQRFTPLLIDAARPCRHSVGDRWFVDETYVKVAGVWRYVYRAVDQYSQVIDVYVSKRLNLAAVRTFFTMVLASHGRPEEVTTDLAASLLRVIDELLADVLMTLSSIRTIGSRMTTADSKRG